MRPAHVALLLLLLDTPAGDACPGPPPDLWSLTERAELVVAVRLVPARTPPDPEAAVLVEVRRSLKGLAVGQISVTLDREEAETCLSRSGERLLLLWLVSGDRVLEAAEQDLDQMPPRPEQARHLADLRARLAGRHLSLASEPELTCLEPAALELVGQAVERADALQRAGSGEDERRQFLLELAEDPRTRRIGLLALATAGRWGGAQRSLAPDEQARLAGAFTREPVLDGATPALLELLADYEDTLLDQALLAALEQALERPGDSPESIYSVAEVIGRLLGGEEGWQALERDLGPPPDDELAPDQLRRALDLVRERGPRRVSVPPEAGR